MRKTQTHVTCYSGALGSLALLGLHMVHGGYKNKCVRCEEMDGMELGAFGPLGSSHEGADEASRLSRGGARRGQALCQERRALWDAH